MKTKKIKSLPDKPSKLIRVALRDLEKCERSRSYKIEMGDWHRPNGKCAVCLAGAVMAKTLKADRREYAGPATWYHRGDHDTFNKLRAINYLRIGAVVDAGNLMSFDASSVPHVTVVSYEDNPTQFKRDMRRLAALLAKNGL